VKKQILILGGGFAGLWSAVGAARKLAEQQAETQVEITLVERTTYHNIRVRNYEADLSEVCIPLSDVLSPIGVHLVNGEVFDIEAASRRVLVGAVEGLCALTYDRLVVALGSELVRPPIPGLAAHAFDVDTFAAASRLAQHIEALAERAATQGQFTAVVIGAGLTGLEAATALPERLRRARGRSNSLEPVRVVVVDRLPHVGSDMGDSARPFIEEALRSLGIEQRIGVDIRNIEPDGVVLNSGERIDASTVIWCGGLRANPLIEKLPGARDRFGRLAVDEMMRVVGVPHVLAAGDVACAKIDGHHASVMSCQHGRPMGRFAGHNAAADLLGKPLLPLHIGWYTTILDLGQWGAVYTSGWDRHVIASGPAAKVTKQTINCQRIYPPRTKRREDILAAAAPVVQAPPEVAIERDKETRSAEVRFPRASA
jgi:NADH:ubiquinone reductase (H+-translocating)